MLQINGVFFVYLSTSYSSFPFSIILVLTFSSFHLSSRYFLHFPCIFLYSIFLLYLISSRLFLLLFLLILASLLFFLFFSSSLSSYSSSSLTTTYSFLLLVSVLSYTVLCIQDVKMQTNMLSFVCLCFVLGPLRFAILVLSLRSLRVKSHSFLVITIRPNI
jgi:hypothetical protein